MPRERFVKTWDSAGAEKCAKQRSATMAKKRKLLTPQELALAESRAQELGAYGKGYTEITFELNMSLSKHILQAKNEQVGTMGDQPIPADPRERLQLMRHHLNTMQTETVEEKIKWAHIAKNFLKDTIIYEDQGRSEAFKTYYTLRMEEMSAPQVKELFLRVQNVRRTLPKKTPSLVIAMPQMQPRQYKRPSIPPQTRPVNFPIPTIDRSVNANFLDETYVCGKHFLKRTSKDSEDEDAYFTVLSLFYSPKIGRVFDVVRDGNDCSVKMTEAELKDLLNGAVEVLRSE